MVKRYDLSDGSLLPSERENAQVLVFVSPDAEEKESIKSDFDTDEHTLQSALDPDEVPRIEIDDDSMTIIWKRPLNYSGQDNFYFNVASVGLFINNGRLALVLTEDISIAPTGIRKAHKLSEVMDVLITFLYETIHHYLEHLKVIKMISRELQKKINTSMENKHLIQMFNLSESLVYYTDAVNGNNMVLTRLKAYAEKKGSGETINDLLDDLVIENNQCFKQAEIYSTVFSGLMDARGSIVNNNMNMRLKNLTIINIVFLPLNLLASIGGMSEYSMMTLGLDWRISYSVFIAAMILIGWITAFLIGRMDVKRRTSPFRKQS